MKEFLGNIKGQKGDKGDQGIQGIQGEKGELGASWLVGDVSAFADYSVATITVAKVGDERVGDLYLHSLTGNVWKCTAVSADSTWSYQYTISASDNVARQMAQTASSTAVAVNDAFTLHKNNTEIHVTQAEKDKWDKGGAVPDGVLYSDGDAEIDNIKKTVEGEEQIVLPITSIYAVFDENGNNSKELFLGTDETTPIEEYVGTSADFATKAQQTESGKNIDNEFSAINNALTGLNELKIMCYDAYSATSSDVNLADDYTKYRTITFLYVWDRAQILDAITIPTNVFTNVNTWGLWGLSGNGGTIEIRYNANHSKLTIKCSSAYASLHVVCSNKI